MKTVISTCRNLKCPNNRNGECCLESVNLTPCGPHLDVLICIEAPKAEEDEEKVIMVGGVATRDVGTDPSSK